MNMPSGKSISTALLIWLLLLALVPLNIVLWISLQNSKESLISALKKELDHVVSLNVHFIDNWFHYRESDIHTWSKREVTIEFTKKLVKGFQDSKQPLNTYLQSPEYLQLHKRFDSDYHELLLIYDYIYDILIIDPQGNILYTVKRETDYGTNILASSPQTKMQNTFLQTVSDKKMHFSDLSDYAPSNGVFGFMMAPIFSEGHKLSGIMAVQMKAERIVNNFGFNLKEREGLSHYMVGEDGLLRSSLYSDYGTHEVLRRKIDTEQTRHYIQELHKDAEHSDAVFRYLSPDGKSVIGTHRNINVLGVHWALISEMDEDVALASTRRLSKQMLIIIAITTLAIIIASIIISRRITNPILKLSAASQLIANGKKKEYVTIDNTDEIGQLASSFNLMLANSKRNEIHMLQQSRLAQMGELISMIAHQWRQPLSAISVTAIDLKMKLELEKFDLGDKDGRKACQDYFNDSLDKIGGFVQNLTETINDFRNFYKPNKESVNTTLKEPLTKALAIIKASFDADNIEIHAQYGNKEITLFENELMQVFLNIFKNAQDNFREKDIADRRISIITEDTAEGASVEICDNGGGIEETHIDEIFDPYFSTKDEKNGTGLGLYMSRTIIETHHGGKIYALNKNGGACFYLEFKTDGITKT